MPVAFMNSPQKTLYACVPFDHEMPMPQLLATVANQLAVWKTVVYVPERGIVKFGTAPPPFHATFAQSLVACSEFAIADAADAAAEAAAAEAAAAAVDAAAAAVAAAAAEPCALPISLRRSSVLR